MEKKVNEFPELNEDNIKYEGFVPGTQKMLDEKIKEDPVRSFKNPVEKDPNYPKEENLGKMSLYSRPRNKNSFMNEIEESNQSKQAGEEIIKQIVQRQTIANEIKEELKHKGLRYNTGKLRYDLLHPIATDALVQVLTRGAQKYAERNWEKGMSWMTVIASLKRHLAALEKGEDYDQETGLLHIDHVQCNAHFISTYYKTYPQGDDRPHRYLNMPKIGLDIDEVLADWVGAWCGKFGHDKPNCWNFSYTLYDEFKSMEGEELNSFYLSIPRKIEPSELPFEPHCYITSRSVPVELTKEWLRKNGFPTVPVYSIGFGKSKVDVAKESGVEIFVDDRYDNFVELNKAGICTFLWDAPHNQRYNVGYKRIKSLRELI